MPASSPAPRMPPSSYFPHKTSFSGVGAVHFWTPDESTSRPTRIVCNGPAAALGSLKAFPIASIAEQRLCTIARILQLGKQQGLHKKYCNRDRDGAAGGKQDQRPIGKNESPTPHATQLGVTDRVHRLAGRYAGLQGLLPITLHSVLVKMTDQTWPLTAPVRKPRKSLLEKTRSQTEGRWSWTP